MHCLRSFPSAIGLAALLAAGPALAAGQDSPTNQDMMNQGTAAQPSDSGERMEARTDASETVQNATEVAERMRTDAQVSGLLEQSRGVFIVPNLVRGAFVVGAEGGDGVLVGRQDGTWSPPAFYTLGSLSIGAQGGGEVGAVAMILMSDEALQRFQEDDTFSISADADLTIVDYSASTQADLQDSDIVMWSDKQGAFAGVSLRASDIGVDEEANHAYYDDSASPQTILSGSVQDQQSKRLQEALRP